MTAFFPHSYSVVSRSVSLYRQHMAGSVDQVRDRIHKLELERKLAKQAGDWDMFTALTKQIVPLLEEELVFMREEAAPVVNVGRAGDSCGGNVEVPGLSRLWQGLFRNSGVEIHMLEGKKLN